MKTLVVDGTNILIRSIKASERMSEPLSVVIEDQRVITGGVYLFIQMFSRYVRETQPDRIIVCWDGGRSQYRTLIYADYKADREERDDELGPTFAMAKEFLSLNGIHHMEVQGMEADDLVAAYTRSALRDPGEVVILSGDKDFLQLVSDRVIQIRPGVKPAVWGVAEVKEKFDCFPEDIPMLMALTGDQGDGVPGIPGFGNKTAVKYLDKYGWSWIEIMRAAEAGEDEKLAGRQDDMERNMALVNLQVVIDENLEGGFIPLFEDHPEMTSEITRWLGGYGFLTLLNRFQSGVLWKESVQESLPL